MERGEFMRYGLFLLIFLFFTQNSQSGEAPYSPSPISFYAGNVAFEYSLLNEKKQLLGFLAARKTISDQKFIKEQIAKLDKLPSMKHYRETLTLQIEQQIFKVDLAEIAKGTLQVNGHRFKLDEKKSIKDQAMQLAQILDKVQKTAGHLFISKAYAAEETVVTKKNALLVIAGAILLPIGLKLVDVLKNAAADGASYAFCWAGIDQWGSDKLKASSICKDYLKTKEDQLKKSPEIGAAKGALIDLKTPIETGLETCPHTAQGTEQYKVYKSTLLLIKEKLRLRLKAEIEGSNVKKIEVLAFDTPKLLATYVVTAENELDKIKIPNPKASEPKKNPQEIVSYEDLEISATADIADPYLHSQQNLHKAIFAHFGLRLHVCQGLREADDAAKAKKELSNQPVRSVQTVEEK